MQTKGSQGTISLPVREFLQRAVTQGWQVILLFAAAASGASILASLASKTSATMPLEDPLNTGYRSRKLNFLPLVHVNTLSTLRSLGSATFSGVHDFSSPPRSQPPAANCFLGCNSDRD